MLTKSKVFFPFGTLLATDNEIMAGGDDAPPPSSLHRFRMRLSEATGTQELCFTSQQCTAGFLNGVTQISHPVSIKGMQ